MEQKCCDEIKPDAKNGFLSAIIYGLIPHSFCLAFGFFSVVGAVTVSAFLKNVLLIPNIFNYLLVVSLALATVSVCVYLSKLNSLCRSGVARNWKYIFVVFFTTIVVNLTFFYVAIPALANFGSNNIISNQQIQSEVSLKVAIPCTGHSFLIMDEIKKCDGVRNVTFAAPDIFKVKYDQNITTVSKIMSQEIFKTFKISIF